MIIAIDAGNTNIVLGVIEDNKILFSTRFRTVRDKTEDEYAVFMKNILELHGVNPGEISGGIISSVVPPLTAALKRAVRLITGTVPMVVGPGIKTGLNILIDNPRQLGSDMVVDSIAALNEHKGPLIILDMGTATTMSVLDGKGNYVGTAIIPGVQVSQDALTNATSQLPRISLEAPNSVIGTNTVDAMQSGIVFGQASLIDGMIDRINEKLGESATVIATGGLAHSIIPHCKHRIIYDNDLLIKGLMIIYEKNKK